MTRKSFNRKSVNLVAVIFIIVAIAIIATGVFAQIDNNKFYKKAVKTNAVITNITSHTKSYYSNHKRRTKTEHEVYISYEADGTEYNDVRLNGYISSMYEGKNITVYYDPKNPVDVRYKNLSNLLWLTYVFGGAFLIIGLALIVGPVKTNRSKKKLKETGLRLQGQIVSITPNTSIKVNGRCPFIVEVVAMDSETGINKTYVDKKVWGNVDNLENETVNIYVDRNKSDKYYMDINDVVSRINGYN